LAAHVFFGAGFISIIVIYAAIVAVLSIYAINRQNRPSLIAEKAAPYGRKDLRADYQGV
jgi:hypothetical protein